MANGTLKVSNIQTSSGSGTITLGQSGETINIPSGATVSGAGANTPAFEANLSSTTSLSHNTITLAPFDTEVFDTDNCYDNSSNYRFTPTTAGKYFVYAQARLSESDASNLQYAQAFIYKNGSSHYQVFYDFRNNYLQGMTVSITGTIDFNGSSDYIDFRVLIAGNNDGDENLVSGATSRFGAYKIIE